MDPATGLSCAFAPNRLLLGDSHGDDPRLKQVWLILGDISRSLG